VSDAGHEVVARAAALKAFFGAARMPEFRGSRLEPLKN